MIDNRIDLTTILGSYNFTKGKIPDPNSYRKQSFCFSLNEYFGSGVINIRTNLFVFTLEDIFLENIILELQKNNLEVSVEFTGLKENYQTYEITMNKAVQITKGEIDLW